MGSRNDLILRSQGKINGRDHDVLWVTAVSWGSIVTTVGVGVPRGSLSPPLFYPPPQRTESYCLPRKVGKDHGDKVGGLTSLVVSSAHTWPGSIRKDARGHIQPSHADRYVPP